MRDQITQARLVMDMRQTSTKRELEHALKQLRARVNASIEGLEKGEELDPNLIMNASGIATHIARYNLLRDLLPYVEPGSETKT